LWKKLKNIGPGKKVNNYVVNCCGKKFSPVPEPGVKINNENCKKTLVTTGSGGPFTINYLDCGNNQRSVEINGDLNQIFCGSNFPPSTPKVNINEIGYC